MRTATLLILLAAAAVAHDWNGIARTSDGSLYVIDAEDGHVWRISPDGKVKDFITGPDGEGCNHPHHIAADKDGILWIPSG